VPSPRTRRPSPGGRAPSRARPREWACGDGREERSQEARFGGDKGERRDGERCSNPDERRRKCCGGVVRPVSKLPLPGGDHEERKLSRRRDEHRDTKRRESAPDEQLEPRRRGGAREEDADEREDDPALGLAQLAAENSDDGGGRGAGKRESEPVRKIRRSPAAVMPRLAPEPSAGSAR
jgi:hypothetical protein